MLHKVEAVRILHIGIAVARGVSRLEVHQLVGFDLQRDARAGSRIERGVIVEAVAEAVVDWLHQEAAAIRLQTILVHAGKLAEFELNFVVQHRVLQPVGVEDFGARADQAAGIGDAAQVVGAEVWAALPEAGDVEGQAIPACQFSEVDVHGAADTIPTCSAGLDGCLRCVQEIGNIEEIKSYAVLLCQFGALCRPSPPADIAGSRKSFLSRSRSRSGSRRAAGVAA